MQLKTILNRVTNYKSFVFGKIEIVESISGKLIEVEVQSRRNGQRICSGCSKVRPGYDTMQTSHRLHFVPMWGMAVVFIYFMRRVNCPDCGVRVEQVPWGDGKSPVTHELKWFLAKWAKLMRCEPRRLNNSSSTDMNQFSKEQGDYCLSAQKT